MMLTFLSILLLSSHALPLIDSLNCDVRTQYLEKVQCCQKCKPGQYMKLRCQPGSFDTQCESCRNGYFTADFNIYFKKCSECTKCSKEYMKYETNCTLTRDAVCTCDEGYQCSDSTCQTCVKVQTTATTMTNRPLPPTTVLEKGTWISVSLCFACVCLCTLFTCFLLISRHARPYERIMPTSTCFSSSKRVTLVPASAQRKRKYRCQCRKCAEKQRNWKKFEKEEGRRRQPVRLWIKYLL